MDSGEELKLRKIISENVINNISIINELLLNPPKSEIISKADDLLLLCKSKSDDITHNQPFEDYHNFKTIELLTSLTEIDKISIDEKETKKQRHRLHSQGSRTSLASFPSIEDFNSISSDDIVNEIQKSIDDMKANLTATSHSPLSINFLHEMKSKDLRKKSKLLGFVVELKRLQNELEKIALSDNASSRKSRDDADDFDVDDATIDDLRTLNKVKTEFFFLYFDGIFLILLMKSLIKHRNSPI